MDLGWGIGTGICKLFLVIGPCVHFSDAWRITTNLAAKPTPVCYLKVSVDQGPGKGLAESSAGVLPSRSPGVSYGCGAIRDANGKRTTNKPPQVICWQNSSPWSCRTEVSFLLAVSGTPLLASRGCPKFLDTWLSHDIGNSPKLAKESLSSLLRWPFTPTPMHTHTSVLIHNIHILCIIYSSIGIHYT